MKIVNKVRVCALNEIHVSFTSFSIYCTILNFCNHAHICDCDVLCCACVLDLYIYVFDAYISKYQYHIEINIKFKKKGNF